VDLARQIFGNLAGTTTLLLGAGEMAEAAAKLLVKSGADLMVVNRSPERAEELARSVGGRTRPWADLASCLVQADVVVASTAARNFVITRTMTAAAMKGRRGRSLFFIDIAVPRDIDPAVNDLANVYLYDIDDLSQIVAESMRGRLSEAEKAGRVVDSEAETFEKWAGTRNLTPTIVALRAKARAALISEMDKSLSGRLKHLSEADRVALGTMLDAAVNKLLHAPITRIKALASDPRGDDLVQALRHLFDLPELGTDDGEAPVPEATAASPAHEPAADREPAA
jgi:glutamyl-tRNA reductase